MGVLILSGCKDNDPTPTPIPHSDCSYEGTMTNVLCGSGAYGNLYIRLDDSTYLQPCETEVIPICNSLNLRDGTRVKFGYKPITSGGCDSIITCMAINPMVLNSKKVKITCMEVISQPGCKHLGTVKFDVDCNRKYIVLQDSSKIEPVNQDELNDYTVDQQILCDYNQVYTLIALCGSRIPVQLSCISYVGICGNR
jgi:hypothetical protein